MLQRGAGNALQVGRLQDIRNETFAPSWELLCDYQSRSRPHHLEFL
jgi:hypothetical protein